MVLSRLTNSKTNVAGIPDFGAASLFGFGEIPAAEAAVARHWLDEPNYAGQAGKLLHLAAREVEAERRRTSTSLLRRVFSSSDHEVQTWQSYGDKIELRLKQGPLDSAALQALLAQAPQLAGTPLLELRCALQENTPQGFARSLLRLAESYAYQHRYPDLSSGLLEAAGKEGATGEKVEALQAVLSGRGSLMQQLRYEVPHLLSELASPLSLLSFGAMVWSARAAGAAVLAHASRYSLATWTLSEGAALAVEVPVLTMTRRLGTQLIHGGEDLFSMESIRQELKASYGPFALLRVGSSAFLLGMPWFRRTFRDLGVGETAQDLLLKTTHFGMELSSVLAGHGLNAMWNLENPMPLAENALLSAVLTVTHMRGMGWVLSKFARPGGVTEWWMHHRRRLAQADLFQGPMPGASRGIASIFEALLGPQLEYAGIPGSRGRSNFAEALMWHMGKRSDPPDPNKTTLVPLPPDIETLSSRLARLIDSGSAQRNPSEALELLKHLEEVIPLLRREGAFTRKYFNALLFHLPYDHFKTLCHRLIESYPHHPREIQEEIGELLTLYCFCLNKGDRGRTFERLIAVVESQTRPPEASAGPGRDLVGELEEISRLIDDPSVPEAGLSRDTEAVADFVVKMLPRVFDPSRNTSSLTSDIRDLRPLNYETPTQPAPESKMPLAAVVIPKLRGLTNFAKVAARALALTRNPRTATWEDIQAISRAVLELGSPEKAAPEYMAALQAIAKRHPDKKIQQYAQETFDELSKLKD